MAELPENSQNNKVAHEVLVAGASSSPVTNKQPNFYLVFIIGLPVVTLMTAFGILALLGWPIAAAEKRLHLIDSLFGKEEITGKLETKWVASDPEKPKKKELYFKVDSLPFKVHSNEYEQFEIDETVVVTYWTWSKDVITVERLEESHTL